MWMTKIFTFGCSFTRYYWPTWSDIMAFSNPDLEVINVGRIGIGNTRIFQRIQECHLNDTISDGDRIMVAWSGWKREDRYVYDAWNAGGKTSRNPDYGPEFTEKYCNPKFMAIKNASAIIAANQLYNITWNGSMGSYPKDIPSLYEDQIPKVKSYDDIPFTRWNGRSTDDLHPDINTHAIYYRTVIGMNIPDWQKIYALNDRIASAIDPSMKRKQVHEIAANISMEAYPQWTPPSGDNMIC